MENQRYFLKRALKIFFISFFCLQIMGVGFDFLFGKSKIFKLFFLNHHPKAVGFIVGSSKSLTGIDTKLLSDSLGMEIINLSEDDSPLELHIMTLNYLKEKNRKIKFL